MREPSRTSTDRAQVEGQSCGHTEALISRVMSMNRTYPIASHAGKVIAMGKEFAMPETFMVSVRDGICLATDVYLPDGPGPFPVIMERTPYGRQETSRSEITAANRTPASRAEIAAYFTEHGYAVVYQDTRGRYGSEGT